MRRLLPLLVVALAAACISTGGGEHPVQRVTLHGNKAFHDSEIVDRLATRPPHGWLVHVHEELDPVALDVDADRIETFYHERGYFDAKVTNVKVKNADKGKVEVDIDVDEGEPTKVSGVEFEGADDKLAQTALDKADVDLRLDHPFQAAEYENAKTALEKAFQKRGYAYAKVTGVVEVDRVEHQATVRFTLDLGPLTYFGTFKIQGLSRIKEETVKHRIAWKEGEVFDPDLIELTEGRLFSLGVFSSVRVSYPHRDSPEVANMTIHVGESTTHEVRAGFGAAIDNTRLEVHVRGGYTIHGIFGQPLLTFRTDATPGWSWLRDAPFTAGPTVDIINTLDGDDMFTYNLHGQALLAFDRLPHVGYILTGPRAGLTASYPLAHDALKLTFGWSLQYLIFDEYDPLVFGPESTANWLGYYSQAVTFDLRDRPLDAHRGFYAAVETLEGGPVAGGEVGFFRITPELRGYVPIGHRLVLAARARWGKIITGGTDDAPLPIRYLGGGANDHRGFGFERLSPERRDSTGRLIPVGGTDDFLATAEARLDLFKLAKQWFSMAAFFDTGDVTGPGGIDYANLHNAVGFGFRYDTVIGPIRADIGFRLNRIDAAGPDGLANPDPGDWWAFHISLGEAF